MDSSTVIAVGSVSSGCALIGIGFLFIAHVDLKIKQRGLLCAAAGAAIQMLGAALTGHMVVAAINAAAMATLLYAWWNSGGGDGMKRLLKKAAGYLGFGPQAVPQGA